MKCSCGEKTLILETRHGKDFKKRRRHCPACGNRFTTKESYAERFDLIKELEEKLEAANSEIAKLTKLQKTILGLAQ
jgi:transcriptional regulator NrdR family protein